ncbi:hypothetical protein [Couchioplanes azureus]|uniref:hypothetical protein n=1 Tax=Couchioplanes caeruleus TaxID=56438 RepID=UPI00167069A9|nr:hypothetical protein [Couchioplanes caeruleus]GGQ45483.1 hypothetical protein GCM10010166_12590 [Couchioplanes caeruleus subsp. azureus]
MSELWLDPGQAAGGGHDLAASGRRLAAPRAEAGSEVAALSAARPWGSDDIGQAFERNYRPVEQQVLQAWERLAGHVEGLGDASVQAVRELLQTDQTASVRVEQSYGNRS